MSAHAATAPRYRGPSAVGDDLRRFWSLTWMLAVTDFKLRFFGSALGYVWTLMRPLLLFGVLYFVFTEVVRLGGDIEHYPVYLLTSIVMFTFFSETTSRGRDLARGAREPAAQGALPAARDPAVGGAARALQPRAEHDRGVRVRVRLRDRAAR